MNIEILIYIRRNNLPIQKWKSRIVPRITKCVYKNPHMEEFKYLGGFGFE